MEAYGLAASFRQTVEPRKMLRQPVGGSQRPVHHPICNATAIFTAYATANLQLNTPFKLGSLHDAPEPEYFY
jgi:hypothetical protein